MLRPKNIFGCSWSSTGEVRPTYSEQRGHPRLRMRHAPFAVTPAMRDRWLKHMRDAIDSIELTPQQEHELWTYMERAAYSMVEHL